MTEPMDVGVITIDGDLSLKVIPTRAGEANYELIRNGSIISISDRLRLHIDSWLASGLWLKENASFTQKLATLAHLRGILIELGVEPGGQELVGLLGAYNLLSHECAQDFLGFVDRCPRAIEISGDINS